VELSLTSHDTTTYALDYISRGWAVVPLHDVVGGTCSCGSADPKHDRAQGGKHPLYTGWQNAGIRDAAGVRDAWARRPGANLGIVTGRASGIWALDVDPDNAGDRQLAGLVAAFGPLPETRIHRTGSGGAHYLWLMPDFEFTNSRGRLPLGLDVRGNASQVVAPPSFTLKGPYGVLLDAPVVAAPGWLLGMIKPAERVEVDEEVQRGQWSDPRWSPEAGVGMQNGSDRGSAYAGVAVRDLLAQLAGAGVGERNTTAYRVGRRLAELVASPWSGLNVDHVWAAYMEACAVADVDGGFSQAEAHDVLVKAVRDQGGRGVALPAADFYGTVVPWVPPTDFDQAGQVPGAAGVSVAGSAESINGPVDQGVVAPAVDPTFDLAVRVEMGRQMVRDEARRRLTENDKRPTDFDRVALDDAGLALLPAPVPLVAGWLDRNTLARINGPSGHGKSFVVLDFGACVATGRQWHGLAVAQVPVCYVLAEGAQGMAARARSWCERHDATSTGITFVPRPVQVAGPEWEAFKAWCVRRAFGLIVFDTQARNTVGVDENDATETGQIVAGLDEIRALSGACALLVHHRGLRGDHGRGSTAMRGALDIELDVSRQGSTVTLKSTKQKDRADPAQLQFTMQALGDSVVLVGERDSLGPFTSPTVTLTLRERCAMAIAHALIDAHGSGLTRAEAQTHARVTLGLGADESTRRTVRRAWSDLVDLGRIAKAQGREAHFFIDIEGATILQANPDKVVAGGPEVYLP
jgi:hypothetical protein